MRKAPIQEEGIAWATDLIKISFPTREVDLELQN